MPDIQPVRNIWIIHDRPTIPYKTYEDNLYGRDRSGLEYLVKKRGLKPSTLQHFHVGFSESNEIVMPVFKDDELIDYKFRGIIEKIFKRHPKSETWVFNEKGIEQGVEDKALIVVEGEIDAMSLWQLGFKNVISLVGGAQGPTPWVGLIPEDLPVYLCLDNDDPGQDAAQKLAERLGLSRCRNVVFECKDANDFLTGRGTEDEFQKLLDNAAKFRVQDIFRIDEVIDKLENNKLERIPTFLDRLTSHLDGGIPAKSLVTISGRTGAGKSTALMNMLIHHASEGRPVLLISLENDLFFTIQRLLEIKYKKSYDEFTREEWENIKEDMTDYPFYIDVSMDSYTMPKIDKVIKQSKALFGVEFFGFDHIGFIPARDDAKEISHMVREFKMLCRKYDIITYMVSHVRRSNNENDYLSSEELKGSSSIAQDSDIVLFVVDLKSGLEISIDKARMSKSKLRIPILFNGDTGVMEDDMSRSVKHYDQEIVDPIDSEDKTFKTEESIEY